MNVTSVDILIRLNQSGNLVLRHSCHCRLGSLPLTAAGKGRNTLLRQLVHLENESLMIPGRWQGGHAHLNHPACLVEQHNLIHYWASSFVLVLTTEGDVLWWSLIRSVTGHSNFHNINRYILLLPRTASGIAIVFYRDLCWIVTTPCVGFQALIWSYPFPWLLFHSLSHLLWCIKPSLVVCVLFNPFNSFDCWTLKDKRDK